MKKMRRYLILMAIAMQMVACSNEAVLSDNNETQQGLFSMDNAITFSVEMEAGTRAAEEKTAIADGDQIGVFASYTGDVKYNLSTVTPNYMYNQMVKYNLSETQWIYEPVKYWPNTSDDNGSPKDYVSFFSYYPYTAAGAAEGIIGFSNSDAAGDPWLVYQIPASAPIGQKDLLYGTAMLDVRKQGVDGKVNFSLHHALACVGDEITIKCSDALKTALGSNILYINSVTINYKNLTNKAKLILNSGATPIWQPVYSGEYTSSRTVSLTNVTYIASGIAHTPIYNGSEATDVAINDNGLFYIPLHLGAVRQEAVITVGYTIKNAVGDGVFSSSVTNSYFLKENAQEKETFNIVLGSGLICDDPGISFANVNANHKGYIIAMNGKAYASKSEANYFSNSKAVGFIYHVTSTGNFKALSLTDAYHDEHGDTYNYDGTPANQLLTYDDALARINEFATGCSISGGIWRMPTYQDMLGITGGGYDRSTLINAACGNDDWIIDGSYWLNYPGGGDNVCKVTMNASSCIISDSEPKSNSNYSRAVFIYPTP